MQHDWFQPRENGRTFPSRTGLAMLAAGLLATTAASAQFEDVTIEAEPVAGSVYVLKGAGGNIGVSVGEDAVFMIDDQFAPLTPRIQAAVQKLSDAPIRFVLNTHYHGDHTGGNENLGQAGAAIVAHENVRKRLTTEWLWEIEAMGREEKKPAAPGAWPIVTFTQDVTFHLNDEEQRVFHVPHAHTDGDAIVHFVRANVFHMGDVFFNEVYPFIDIGAGGTLAGVIAAVEQVLELADAQTRFIPGHGPVTDREGLQTYLDLLREVQGRIVAHIEDGKSVDEVVAAAPTAEFDAQWAWDFIPAERFVRILYADLTGN